PQRPRYRLRFVRSSVFTLRKTPWTRLLYYIAVWLPTSFAANQCARERSPGKSCGLRPATRLGGGARRVESAAGATRSAARRRGHADVDRVLARHHPEPRRARTRYPACQYGPVRRPPGGARGDRAAAGRPTLAGARADEARARTARQGTPRSGRSRGHAPEAGSGEAEADGVADPDGALGPRCAMTAARAAAASSVLE